ncbi:MAG: alpha/beta hydrolase domain-containing protein, partial [Alcaligenaceae bacterium]
GRETVLKQLLAALLLCPCVAFAQAHISRGFCSNGPYAPPAGYAQGELCYTLGSYMPFAKTEAERKASGDSRPSIAERYRDDLDYQSRLVAAAQQLVQDRLMLASDVEYYRTLKLP